MLFVLGFLLFVLENLLERYFLFDVILVICGWYDVGVDGDVMDLECRFGCIGMLVVIVKVLGFIVLELVFFDIDIDLLVNLFWNDGLLDVWWRMGRICLL